MSQEGICPIWGTEAKFNPNQEHDYEYEFVDSPRAGGKYRIPGIARAEVKVWSEKKKVLLTSWLIEQRRLGVKLPRITSEILLEIKKRRPPSVHERADNLLRYVEKNSDCLGDFFGFDATKEDNKYLELLAWTSSNKISEVLILVEYCAKKEWIWYEHISSTYPYDIILIPDGYARLAELDGINTDSKKCFVAMWFDKSMDEVYKNGIAPAIEFCGYVPIIIKEKDFLGGVTDEIIAEIKRSRFVIADFTSEKDKPRGGVYYEAGFAHGLNLPVIYTCKDNMEDVHFDTKHLNHIVWKTPEELKVALINRISAVIGDGPNK